MASPCEVIIDSTDPALAKRVGELVAFEVWRIQDKYSRYDANSFCSQINQSTGQRIAIDEETYQLLCFAQQCYQLSEGLFDISSGVLGKLWKFDRSDNIAQPEQIKQLMAHVGFSKVSFAQHYLVLPAPMQLDFGGIGKEYAVDRAIIKVKEITDVPVLVNLGGDLCATSPRNNRQPWQVGIENPAVTGNSTMVVSLYQGALATSGDASRYLVKDGKRYSHVLNAKTGWPIEDAPRSMTVAAPQCSQAGLLATLSLLQGSNAEAFLTAQHVKFWPIR